MTRLLRLPSRPRLLLLPILPWALTMILLPIVGWTLGEAALIHGMAAGVLMQALAVLTVLASAWGLVRAVRTFALVAVLSFLAEWIGSTSGFPFGKYHYTEVLQPQVAGVPLLIPLAWMMMLPPAWAIARSILPAGKGPWAGLKFILVSALAFTAWDLFLDPQMVGWGFWVWEMPGQYFGIPLVNYLGWILVSALLTFAANPKDLPTQPLMLIYIITWLLQTIGQGVFWSQPGPAAFGFLGMGIFILLALRSKPTADRQP